MGQVGREGGREGGRDGGWVFLVRQITAAHTTGEGGREGGLASSLTKRPCAHRIEILPHAIAPIAMEEQEKLEGVGGGW